MDAPTSWKSFFANWPAGLSRSGVLVTSWNEQIPFEAFLHNETMLLVERRTPDTLGARKVIIAFDEIAAVKITEVVQSKVFADAGFEGAPAKK